MDDYAKDPQIRKSIEENPCVEVDYIVEDGVYACTVGEPVYYDVRKAAKLGEELGLKLYERLPDEYWEKCLL